MEVEIDRVNIGSLKPYPTQSFYDVESFILFYITYDFFVMLETNFYSITMYTPTQLFSTKLHSIVHNTSVME